MLCIILEYAEASIQDEDGDHHKAFVQKSNEPSRQPTRQSKNLQPVEEIVNFEDVFELEDEESWVNVNFMGEIRVMKYV